MKTKETSKPRLFNKQLNSYAEWNGSAWEDKNVSGAYFYSIEKANNNGWFEETSTREQALAWWNGLTKNQQYEFCLKQSDVDDLLVNRQLSSLTGREIEEIWRKECSKVEDNVFLEEPHIDKYGDLRMNKFSKPNQKQFKQFDESLFKAYLDKFSDEDKIQMLATLACEISTTNINLNDLLNRISCYKIINNINLLIPT